MQRMDVKSIPQFVLVFVIWHVLASFLPGGVIPDRCEKLAGEPVGAVAGVANAETLQVSVREAGTKTPVQASVIVVGKIPFIANALTNAEGRADIEVPSFDRLSIGVRASGCATECRSAKELERGHVIVELEPALRIFGVVMDSSGKPVAQSAVGVEDLDSSSCRVTFDPYAQLQMTNDRGEYVLRDVDARREFQIVARHPQRGEQIANKVLPTSNDLAEGIAVAPAQLPTVLQAGDRVSVVLAPGHAARGKVLAVGGSDVTLHVKASQTPDIPGLGRQTIPYDQLARISVTRLKGNKRTKLPVILCATLGTLAFVAAGATEELKSTYLPLAAGFTAGLGIGGYFVGKKLDEEVVTYVIRNK